MATNTARDLLWPKPDDNVVVRVVFLNVGQGASTLVLFADGNEYRSLLIDINLDAKCDGIHVPNMLADLLENEVLDVFVNSHPHEDHLNGIRQLSDTLSIGEIWHSGHKPSKDSCPSFRDLQSVISAVSKENGADAVTKLKGSDSPFGLGDVQHYVLAPAEYVSDDINGEKPAQRDARIHEQCAVLRIGIGDTWVLLPGDADRPAFENHIAKHHADRLRSVAMGAPHHGSRSFFFLGDQDDEEPYFDALQSIAPEYAVISAPTCAESPYDHPDQDAIDAYAHQVGGEDAVLHTGKDRYSFICDIYRDGSYGGVIDDQGELSDAYPIEGDDDGDDKDQQAKKAMPSVITRVDDRPMGGPWS
jgi:competence protein ComEC